MSCVESEVIGQVPSGLLVYVYIPIKGVSIALSREGI